jgi:hypothetical protein
MWSGARLELEEAARAGGSEENKYIKKECKEQCGAGETCENFI